MKKLVLLIAVALSSFTGYSQSEKYINAMRTNLVQLDSGFNNPPYLLTLADNFERIGLAEKKHWLPYYYSALAIINYSFIDQDKTKTDDYANRAELILNKADELSPANSEISCLRSMIASTRLMVNPMERYMQYGMTGAAALEKAIAEDPTNPRPYYLKGQSLKYTPAQFGGGCATAMKELEIAMNKFKSFKPATPLSPSWGQASTEKVMSECR